MTPLHTFRGYFYKYSLKKKLYIFQTKLQNTWFKSEKRNKGWLATGKWSDDEMQSRTGHKRLLGNQKLGGYFTPVGGHFTSCALWLSQQCGWAPWGQGPWAAAQLFCAAWAYTKTGSDVRSPHEAWQRREQAGGGGWVSGPKTNYSVPLEIWVWKLRPSFLPSDTADLHPHWFLWRRMVPSNPSNVWAKARRARAPHSSPPVQKGRQAGHCLVTDLLWRAESARTGMWEVSWPQILLREKTEKTLMGTKERHLECGLSWDPPLSEPLHLAHLWMWQGKAGGTEFRDWTRDCRRPPQCRAHFLPQASLPPTVPHSLLGLKSTLWHPTAYAIGYSLSCGPNPSSWIMNDKWQSHSRTGDGGAQASVAEASPKEARGLQSIHPAMLPA